MDNSFFQNFLAGAQLADREHEMQQQAEEHKLIVQQHKLALDTAKLEQAKHLREIQAMQSGGPITQPPNFTPDTRIAPPQTPELDQAMNSQFGEAAPTMADILTKIRQQPVQPIGDQNQPIMPLPGPNIPINLSTGMVTIPGTNREMAQQEAARQREAAINAKLAEQVHPGSEFGLYTGTGRQIAPPSGPKPKNVLKEGMVNGKPAFAVVDENTGRVTDPNTQQDITGSFVPKEAMPNPTLSQEVVTVNGKGPFLALLKKEGGKSTYLDPNTGEPIQGTVGAYERPREPRDTSLQQSNQLERSYNARSTEFEKVAQPVADALQRVGRLKDTINNGSPIADSVTAPELIVVMAGGQGSGVRITGAEIASLMGGQSKWEQAKAALAQWSTDPAKANKILEPMRNQIRALLATVDAKLQAKQAIIESTRQQLIDAPDEKAHKQVVANARNALAGVDTGRPSGPQVGQEEGGYIFQGGNPADPKSWKKK